MFLPKTLKLRSSLLIICLLLLPCKSLWAQSQPQSTIDSLIKQLETAKLDTSKVNLLDKISASFSFKDRQKALFYATQELELAKEIGWVKGQVIAYAAVGQANSSLNEEKKALEF